jgi:hypothetical protein
MRRQAFIARQISTKNSIYDDGGRQRADGGHASVEQRHHDDDHDHAHHHHDSDGQTSAARPPEGPTARRERRATGIRAGRASAPGGHSRAGPFREPRTRDTIRTPLSVLPVASIGYIGPQTPTRGERRKQPALAQSPHWAATAAARSPETAASGRTIRSIRLRKPSCPSICTTHQISQGKLSVYKVLSANFESLRARH